MSNLSTLPKGDSAWLLRKAIERIMEQVSVLETNIGSSTTGNSANTQIIFNDNGTLRGDAGLVYNKTTDTLTAGNATITGALTVDTSTLKVDSTNHRVGIGTATPGAGYVLDVVGAARITAANGLVIDKAGAGFVDFLNSGNSGANVGTSGTGGLVIYTANGIGGAYGARYVIDSTGISTWSVAGTTAMTLNSTGLGVGGSPSAKIHLFDSTPQISLTDTSNSNYRYSIQNAFSALRIFNNTTSTEVCRFDASGNVGIGIAPSAWANTTTIWKALDLQYSCGIASSGAGSGEIDFLWNAYYDQTDQRWEFKYTGDRASRYAIGGAGVHTWYNTASTGTANAPITWVPAMTLDASGNLLVGKTSSANTVAGVKLFTDSVDGGREYFTRQAGAASQTHVVFFESGGGVVGSISTTNVATAYNIASDYRLKQSVQPLTGGLARVNSLKPSTYKWNLDGSAGEGFIAHELAEVVPFAVSGQKDAVNEDGSIKIQGVDLSKIVPILVAAIQELTARVQTLEAR